MSGGRLHTDAAVNATITTANVNKSAWQQDDDSRVSILDEFFGHQRRTPPEGGYAPVAVENQEALVAWVQTLPPLYRDAIARRASEETGYQREMTWEGVVAEVRVMDLPDWQWEELRRKEPWLHRKRRESPYRLFVRALLRHAQAVRDIISSVDRRAHDLIGAGDAAIRDRAKSIAEDELAQLTAPTATTLDTPDALDRRKIVRHLAAADDLYVIVDGQEMTAAEADARGIEWGYAPDVQRLTDPAWWTRRLRAEITEACLLIGAHLGIVGHGRSLYVDDHILDRHQDRQAANAAMAAATVMRSGDEEVLLADLIRIGQDAALARVYAQCLGMQHLGEVMGLVPVFLTVTLAAEWHPNPKYRRKGHRWNGKSGKEARAQLTKDWETYMRRLRGGVIVLGLRVIEPHQDGTPHLHAMVWVAPEDLSNVYRTLRRTFGCAPRAKAVRISAKRKNAAKPSSYLLKYILKTMSATDDEDADAKGTREAHKAWASAVRARRWELIGCASGIQRTWQTVYNWRKLPRDARASEAMRTAWEAMRAADAARAAKEDSAPHWAAAMRVLIGEEALAGGGRAARAVRNTYTEAQNKYGETVKRPDGITDGRVTVRKEQQWTMVRLTADEIAQRQQAQCPASPVNKSPDVGLVASYPREAAQPPPTAPPGAAGQPSGRYDPKSEVIRLIKEREHLPQWQKWIQDRRQHWGLAEAA